jgi:hypothetical protein
MTDTPTVLTDGAVVLSYDQFRETTPNGAVAPEYNAPMVLRNRMINVDQMAPELRGYKHITAVYPAADLHPNSQPLQISWGGFDYVNTPARMGPYLQYTPDGFNYKLDFMAEGRFLDMRLLYEDDVYDVRISALDVDLNVTGKR